MFNFIKVIKVNHKVKSFYHEPTYTWTHLVICLSTKNAVIIDPVLDYNTNSARTSTTSVDAILAYLTSNNIKLNYVLETHAHADHITAADYIKNKLDIKLAIGEKISGVQKTFKSVFNLGDEFLPDGSQFDRLFKDNDCIGFGECEVVAIHTPGHTDDSMSYCIGDNVFIGDTLFSPDYGSARCDFPGGDAEKLYDSIQKIYQLGEHKKLYLCHDYPPSNRLPQAWFLSKQQQLDNIHINKNVSKKAFVNLRNTRDISLKQPRLIIPSIQVNIAAGRFPKPDCNGITYLKTPINVIGS